jgi:hypothetical protein
MSQAQLLTAGSKISRKTNHSLQQVQLLLSEGLAQPNKIGKATLYNVSTQDYQLYLLRILKNRNNDMPIGVSFQY